MSPPSGIYIEGSSPVSTCQPRRTPLVTAIFILVAGALYLIAFLTGLTYVEVNVIIWYMIAPLVYAILLDVIFRTRWLRSLWILACSGILLFSPDPHHLAEQVFDGSVRFLESFKRYGMNYYTASVIICVVLPILVLVVLIAIIVARRFMSWSRHRNGIHFRVHEPGLE